ncbi:YbgF trimerization domain-containing protein [Sphingomonas japonica]|uniref:TolA-binding protein n=1 Tax=Sphingomonas japonica TaxID=511662 RepID=A0ABX0U0V8_9SPHN|nr:YbgF trimerization domain-containing protein [Sphingomonas japonica]NIJ23007.1 TolA-binding protein [Sphingomonas japonica]
MRTMFCLMLLSAAAIPVSAGAQTVEGRVDRLEREMRAVQRSVFPNGAGLIEPQITAPQSPMQAPGSPSNSAVVDLTARVSALESQLTAMTGQIEQSQYRLRQFEDQFAEYRKATDARLAAMAPAAPTTDSIEEVPATAGAGGPTEAPPVRPTRPANAAAAASVERPDTGDAAEDSYVYGYRLWNAKLYPEAIAELKTVVAKYPAHRRASFAQNLIGRAYLDDGKPSLASIAFYDSYKKLPDGERAPDSLLYLGTALTELKKPKDACKVYAELEDVYGDKLSAAMRADLASGRATAKCT